MRDLLPENGASAVMLPDPQERVAVAEKVCAHCDRLLWKWDEVKAFHVGDDKTFHFCDNICLSRWLEEKGTDWLIKLLEREGIVETEVLGEAV